MKRRGYRIVSLVAGVLLLSSLIASCGKAEQSDETRTLAGLAQRAGLRENDTLLDKTDVFTAGDSISDWVAFGVAGSGRADRGADYLAALKEYVSNEYVQNGGLDAIKSTEWHRISLAILALGGNPLAFGTDCAGNAINLIADGTYAFDGEIVLQGTNGPIFALITLDAGVYDVPDGSRYTRESLRDMILAAQSESGAFGLSRGADNVDITGMALCALAPYTDIAEVQTAVDAAVDYLSRQQSPYGDYLYNGDRSSESVSQIIIGLCALGIDPESDSRFMKSGISLYEALFRFRNEDGSFRHLVDKQEGSDIMATEQALRALLAVRKLRNGGGSIYDFSGN